ncbi:MAG: hypothetical protein COB20_01610 [SAR86 cluster bacterium]|uniref:Activator of Hsp90 ATPase homologue 1/2-like C-terminal domain-containing protein n=1 Tax=SAR86 cluster bacterium TaxID=2030880 RepID=A0A2A4XGQ8_9GAMM|nr:MAG: hypothetical protein COB20_01610 [SAR86 cluster bacterium]
MLDPIVKTIEVPCDQQKAFTVFLDEMASWWPLDKFTTSMMKGAPAKSIKVDTREGGKIIEIGSDDSETLWGTITTYDPYGFFSMDFHIPGPPAFEVGKFSHVEVKFTKLAEQQTQVELTQTNLEVFEDMAEGVHGGYNFGWGLIFEQAYKEACSS